MTGRLTGKVAIITGASRGLGSYCAAGYGAEGASVVIAARSTGGSPDEPGASAHTARLVEAAGGTAFPVACDVGDPTTIQAMVDAVLDRFGRIDVLMTNAVYYAPGSFSTISAGDWDRQFQVNVHGVFHAIRSVLPAMVAQRSGSIITISSIAADRPSHYGATKRAVAGLTAGFAAEQRAHGVAVNSLRPVAAIRTPGWEKSRPPEALQARAHRVSPPDSYVEAAILLAMQSAEQCSGQFFTDAEVLERFGAVEDFERFRALTAAIWSEGF
jgi:citronellol/citronellal dehydrogenase